MPLKWSIGEVTVTRIVELEAKYDDCATNARMLCQLTIRCVGQVRCGARRPSADLQVKSSVTKSNRKVERLKFVY
jgi:hypothetical protein